MLSHEMTVSFSPDRFTAAGVLKPSALQEALMEIACTHAELLGLGYEAMLRDNQIWVITKLKYRLLDTIRPDTDYRLVTFPKHKRGILYQRDFKLFCGDILVAIAISQWCIMDYVSRKVVRTPKDFEGECSEEVLFPEGFDRFRSDVLTPAGSYTITEADLDGNNHTNNGRYAHMVELVLPEPSGNEFSITFAKETRLGDVIALFTAPWENGKTIVCGTVDQQTVFTALI